MDHLRARVEVALIVLAFTLLPVLASPAAVMVQAADPTSSGGSTATPAPGAVDVSGHWETNDFGGMDLVQRGTAVTGTSPAGVSFTGTLTGRRVEFTFWHGASYAKADRADRGHGTMTLSPDGRTLAITWTTEEKPSRYNGRFSAIRVGPAVPPGGGGAESSPAPHPMLTPGLTVEQIRAMIDQAIYAAVYFGAPLPAPLRNAIRNNGEDPDKFVDRLRFGAASILAKAAMASIYGDSWEADAATAVKQGDGTLVSKYWAKTMDIFRVFSGATGTPAPSQDPPWWVPLYQEPGVSPIPWPSPLVNPPSSGNPLANPSAPASSPLVNPPSSGNPLANPPSSGNPLANPSLSP
jgi:hypothetical protein